MKLSALVLSLSFPGLDSEAVMVTLKDLVAISNGSACTSQRYEPGAPQGFLGHLIAREFSQEEVSK